MQLNSVTKTKDIVSHKRLKHIVLYTVMSISSFITANYTFVIKPIKYVLDTAVLYSYLYGRVCDVCPINNSISVIF